MLHSYLEYFIDEYLVPGTGCRVIMWQWYMKWISQVPKIFILYLYFIYNLVEKHICVDKITRVMMTNDCGSKWCSHCWLLSYLFCPIYFIYNHGSCQNISSSFVISILISFQELHSQSAYKYNFQKMKNSQWI